MMFGEMLVVDEYNLQSYIDRGYEFVQTVTDSQIVETNVTEESPPPPSISIGTTYPNNNYMPNTQIRKTVPVVITTTRYLLRRTVAAKTLFESKQNENN